MEIPVLKKEGACFLNYVYLHKEMTSYIGIYQSVGCHPRYVICQILPFRLLG
ncbi:hypothetical protein PSAR109036_04825 [Psychrobacter arenosus]|jgi:hypothetical protein